MSKSLDQVYLSRPLVEDMIYEITPARISIQCPHTIYLQVILPNRLEQSTLLNTYQRVRQLAKTKGTRVAYTRHFSKTIKEQWPQYEAVCEERETVYRQLVEQAKLVRERGIHYGTSDDTELSRLHELHNKFSPFTYRTSIAHIMADINSDLTDLEQTLSKSSVQYEKICL